MIPVDGLKAVGAGTVRVRKIGGLVETTNPPREP